MPDVSAYFDGTKPTNQRYTVGPRTEPIGSVRLQEPFEVSTLDASGDQLRPGVNINSIDTNRLFPVTGPINIARGLRWRC